MNKLLGFALSLGFVVLTGCYESSSVTVHKPGVYMGASDPLLSASSEDRASALNERFTGQIDR